MNADMQPKWRATDGAEPRLLDFVASLIIDVARTHPRVTERDVASWLARVVVGASR